MKLAALSLAALVPTSYSWAIPTSQTYKYEANVEHHFIPWLSTEWSQETVSKSHVYERKYTEASQAHSGGVGVGVKEVSVDLSASTSWSNIAETESLVETFHSSKSSSNIKYQDGVRLVQRTVTIKSCIDSDCHSKIIKDVVSYINAGAVTDSVEKHWKEESYRYLNAFLLPSNSAKVPVKNYGYARYVMALTLTTYRTVKTTWQGGKYGNHLSCGSQQVMTGLCGSGRNADCRHNGKKVYAKIQCSDATTAFNSHCGSWIGDNGRYGTLQQCPSHQPFLSGYCGSGRNKDCNGHYAKGRCCAKHGVKMGACHSLQKGRYGQDLVCPSGYAIHNFCGSGANKDCKGQWTNIQCCKILV